MTFGCLADEGIAAEVKRQNRKAVILCGIETHICVMQTAFSALDSGLTVAVVEDAVSSRRPNGSRNRHRPDAGGRRGAGHRRDALHGMDGRGRHGHVQENPAVAEELRPGSARDLERPSTDRTRWTCSPLARIPTTWNSSAAARWRCWRGAAFRAGYGAPDARRMRHAGHAPDPGRGIAGGRGDPRGGDECDARSGRRPAGRYDDQRKAVVELIRRLRPRRADALRGGPASRSRRDAGAGALGVVLRERRRLRRAGRAPRGRSARLLSRARGPWPAAGRLDRRHLERLRSKLDALARVRTQFNAPPGDANRRPTFPPRSSGPGSR
jgi:hypothetical protein